MYYYYTAHCSELAVAVLLTKCHIHLLANVSNFITATYCNLCSGIRRKNAWCAGGTNNDR